MNSDRALFNEIDVVFGRDEYRGALWSRVTRTSVWPILGSTTHCIPSAVRGIRFRSPTDRCPRAGRATNRTTGSRSGTPTPRCLRRAGRSTSRPARTTRAAFSRRSGTTACRGASISSSCGHPPPWSPAFPNTRRAVTAASWSRSTPRMTPPARRSSASSVRAWTASRTRPSSPTSDGDAGRSTCGTARSPCATAWTTTDGSSRPSPIPRARWSPTGGTRCSPCRHGSTCRRSSSRTWPHGTPSPSPTCRTRSSGWCTSPTAAASTSAPTPAPGGRWCSRRHGRTPAWTRGDTTPSDGSSESTTPSADSRASPASPRCTTCSGSESTGSWPWSTSTGRRCPARSCSATRSSIRRPVSASTPGSPRGH